MIGARKFDGWLGFQVIGLAQSAPRITSRGGGRPSQFRWVISKYEARTTLAGHAVWTKVEQLRVTDVYSRADFRAPPEVLELGADVAAALGIPFRSGVKQNHPVDPLELLAFLGKKK